MPAGTFTIYSRNKDDLRLNDLTGATVKMALVTSSYTPDVTITGHSVWGDVSANEIGAGNGYTAGGATLASLTVTGITGGYRFSSGNAAWTASGGNIPATRRAVMYISGTLWGMTNPLIGHVLLDDTPADLPALTDGNTRTITCPASGWFDIT